MLPPIVVRSELAVPNTFVALKITSSSAPNTTSPRRPVAIRPLLVDAADQAGNSISPGLFTTLLFDACACSHDLVPARRAPAGLVLRDLASRLRRKATWPH